MQELEHGSLDEVSKKLSDSATPRWPIIVSTYAAQQLPEEQRQEANQNIELAGVMRKKIVDEFKPDAVQTQKQLEEDVETYSSIGKSLSRSGGYCNLLLADTAMRLAIHRVSGWVVLHPGDTTESEKLVSMVDAKVVNVKELLERLVDQDADLQQRKSELSKIEADDNLYKAYATIGIELDFMFPSSAQYTSKLLAEPSVTKLVFRMAMTEAIVKMDLPGSLRFFQRGGVYNELDPKDIRPFTQRMGEDAKRYNYPLLQKRKFTENEVLYLINVHKDADVKAAYLGIALQ